MAQIVHGIGVIAKFMVNITNSALCLPGIPAALYRAGTITYRRFHTSLNKIWAMENLNILPCLQIISNHPPSRKKNR